DAKDVAMFRVRLLASPQKHPPARKEQKAAENVDDPVAALDELHPHEDHHAAHDDRAEDAPEEDPVLIEPGHREGLEDQRDDEEVVHRQALLDQIAGEEVDSLLGPQRQKDEAVEDQRERDPEDRPQQRFARRDHVGLAVEDPEIEREEDHDQDEKTNPENRRFGAEDHGTSQDARPSWRSALATCTRASR